MLWAKTFAIPKTEIAAACDRSRKDALLSFAINFFSAKMHVTNANSQVGRNNGHHIRECTEKMLSKQGRKTVNIGNGSP